MAMTCLKKRGSNQGLYIPYSSGWPIKVCWKQNGASHCNLEGRRVMLIA
jgi:hypothetical protein